MKLFPRPPLQARGQRLRRLARIDLRAFAVDRPFGAQLVVYTVVRLLEVKTITVCDPPITALVVALAEVSPTPRYIVIKHRTV